jgi:hypothetical protein
MLNFRKGGNFIHYTKKCSPLDPFGISQSNLGKTLICHDLLLLRLSELSIGKLHIKQRHSATFQGATPTPGEATAGRRQWQLRRLIPSSKVELPHEAIHGEAATMPGLAPVLPVHRRGLALRLVLAALGRAPGARAAGAAVAVVVAVLGGVERVQAVQVHVGVDEVVERGVVAAVRSAPLGRDGDLALDRRRRGQRRAELREAAEGDIAVRAAVGALPGRQPERRRRLLLRVGAGRRRGRRHRVRRGAQIGVGRRRERVEREEERLGEGARVVDPAPRRGDLGVGRREARLRVRRRAERRREAAVPGGGGGRQVERGRGARHRRLCPELRREVVARGAGVGGSRLVHRGAAARFRKAPPAAGTAGMPAASARRDWGEAKPRRAEPAAGGEEDGVVDGRARRVQPRMESEQQAIARTKNQTPPPKKNYGFFFRGSNWNSRIV